MKSFIFHLICLGSLLTVLSACRSKNPEVQPGAIIETAIPSGLVPGSALTLKGRDFGAVTSVQFANTSVASGQFMRTETNELTVKVPLGTQAGAVRVAGEKGPGQPKQMLLLTGGYGLTADNVSTNVADITQSNVSNLCNPGIFVFCYNGSCIGYYQGKPGTRDGITCDAYYTIERIAGADYQVFKPVSISYPQVVLKFEKNNCGTGYTGLVLVQVPNGDSYIGSVLKNNGTLKKNSIVAYSLKDGSELKLCQPDLTGFNPNGGQLCPPGRCSACQ